MSAAIPIDAEGRFAGYASVFGLLGIDIPSFEGHAPGSLLMEALAILFLRQGIKSAAAKD